MQFLDLTLPNIAANLALDEALLDACEDGTAPEVLRVWEPQSYDVVIGYSNSIASEVNEVSCLRDGVSICRRCSGGGTVLQGPGSLDYSVILMVDTHPELETITGANCHIMRRNRDAIATVLSEEVAIQGHTDLAIGGVKFSGNAQRRKRRALLFHGTFLLNFELQKISNYLPMPSREPDYRGGRPHSAFVRNIGLPANTIKTALRKMWSATTTLTPIPDYRPLLEAKYNQPEWNRRF